MDDLISRHAAINALHGIAHRFEDPEDWCILEGEAEFVVSKLPSAQPERIRGRWIKISPAGIYECSVCGQNVMTDDIDVYHYCHGCGADMREDE